MKGQKKAIKAEKEDSVQINIEEYYKKYGPMVLRRCLFLLKDEDMAMDAMQDTFIKVINAQNKLKGDYPSSLLYKIATNVCLNVLSSKKSKEIKTENSVLAQIIWHDNNEKTFIANDLLDRIFKTEKPSTREIAVMHYVDGLTLEQTAKESGLSVSGVRKRLRNLRIKAREMENVQNGF
ncbi:MAG: sigma-70 family RNA polymerase sigma factor [Spirochaetia bacterium]|nr:sigma-70 family RNA polymerase sigma factor [Spirochaetia bacterium]